jgi:hypothetical protein
MVLEVLGRHRPSRGNDWIEGIVLEADDLFVVARRLARGNDWIEGMVLEGFCQFGTMGCLPEETTG